MSTGMSRVCCDSGGGGASLIHQASLTIIDSDIRGLPTNAVGIEIVDEPGAGKTLVPVLCWMYLHWVADFANIGDQAIFGVYYEIAPSPLAALDERVIGQLSNLLIDGASHQAFLAPRLSGNPTTPLIFSGIGQFIDDPSPINEGLYVKATNAGSATGDFTDGSGTSLSLCVEFRVFSNTLGRFLTTAESGWNETTRTFI